MPSARLYYTAVSMALMSITLNILYVSLSIMLLAAKGSRLVISSKMILSGELIQYFDYNFKILKL
jgi:hypothetical protein